MPIPHDFEYVKPQKIEEVVHYLASFGNKAKILAGGTDLANMLKRGFRVPELMIDIKGIKELNRIEIIDNELIIGSLVTFNEIIASSLMKQHFPLLWEAAHLVASIGVRNRATMVGNICSAVACMDSASPLLVHDAVVHTISKNGNRIIPIQNWFIDNKKTDLHDDEFVTHVSIILPKFKYGSSYQKQMRYAGEDLSQSNIGILAFEDGSFKVAFGSVGPIPKRSPKMENLLKGQKINEEFLDKITQEIETVIAPISDVRSSKEYRMQMTKIMFKRGVQTALERLSNQK